MSFYRTTSCRAQRWSSTRFESPGTRRWHGWTPNDDPAGLVALLPCATRTATASRISCAEGRPGSHAGRTAWRTWRWARAIRPGDADSARAPPAGGLEPGATWQSDGSTCWLASTGMTWRRARSIPVPAVRRGSCLCHARSELGGLDTRRDDRSERVRGIRADEPIRSLRVHRSQRPRRPGGAPWLEALFSMGYDVNTAR